MKKIYLIINFNSINFIFSPNNDLKNYYIIIYATNLFYVFFNLHIEPIQRVKIKKAVLEILNWN